jgi:hypothetical protein
MSARKKIVVSRDIGSKAMSLLDELDQTEWEIVLWKEKEPASRQWLEQNVPDATGLLVLLTDKVCNELLPSPRQLSYLVGGRGPCKDG